LNRALEKLRVAQVVKKFPVS